MMIHNEQIRDNPAVRVSAIIRDFIQETPENTLKNKTGEPANLALASHVINTLWETGFKSVAPERPRSGNGRPQGIMGLPRTGPLVMSPTPPDSARSVM